MREALHVFLVVILLGGPLAAAPAHAGKQEQAIALFEKGSKLYEEENYAEALKSFQQAYKLEPAAALFINIAQCHRQLGNHEAAIASLERYLADEPEGDNRAEVEELLATERAALNPPPPEPPPEPAPAPVAAPAPEPAPAPAAEPAPAPASEEDGSLFTSPLFWVAVGGVALVAVGGGVAAVAVATQSEPAQPSGSLGTYDLR